MAARAQEKEEREEGTMDQTTDVRRAARRRARIMRVANVPIRSLLGLPFSTPLGGSLMLLYFTGRRTGRRYRQPVSYVTDGDTLLTPGGGRWKLNPREDEPIRVRLRGRDVRLRPEFVRDPAEVKVLLRTMVAANPRAASFIPFLQPGGEVDREQMATALAHGFCIVRWHGSPISR
jgi:hypothetical protein